MAPRIIRQLTRSKRLGELLAVLVIAGAGLVSSAVTVCADPAVGDGPAGPALAVTIHCGSTAPASQC